MTRLSILLCGLVFTGCASIAVHETPARAALGQSAEQEKRDRAECHQKADEWAQANHLRADTAVCMLGRGYTLHLHAETVRGFVSVVVTPTKVTLVGSDDWTRTVAAEDFVACLNDVRLYADSSRNTVAKALGYRPIWDVLAPAADDVRDRYLTCWQRRGYEAREHSASEGPLEKRK